MKKYKKKIYNFTKILQKNIDMKYKSKKTTKEIVIVGFV